LVNYSKDFVFIYHIILSMKLKPENTGN